MTLISRIRAEIADDLRGASAGQARVPLPEKEMEVSKRIPRAMIAAEIVVPVLWSLLREINIALQPLLASLANETYEICAFCLRAAATNQNDQPEMRSSRGEL